MNALMAFIAAAGPILAQIQLIAPTALSAVEIIKWLYETVTSCISQGRDPTGEEWLKLISHRDMAIAGAKPKDNTPDLFANHQ